MKKLVTLILFFISQAPALELQCYWPPVPDDDLAQLITIDQKPTNYLHLLPSEIHSKILLPYLPISTSAGALVALLGGKNVSNTELITITQVRLADAKRLIKISRLRGCESVLQKQQDRIDMALSAIEKDDDDELDYFVYKERKELVLLAKNRPLGILERPREKLGLIKAAVDKKLCQIQIQQFLSDKSCIRGNILLSGAGLITTGAWGIYKWWTQAQFYDCQDRCWNRVQDESQATDKPCNFTDIYHNHGSTWACIDRMTAQMCNKEMQYQLFINFLPLITVAFIVAGTQGILLLIKKLCQPRYPVSNETEQLVDAYEQAITQAEEGTLPLEEEV